MNASPSGEPLTASPTIEAAALPFDAGLLDVLMEEHGLDAIAATSKHSVQHLLGGHRFFWFDYMDAVGVSRYLPFAVYFRGAPEKTFYIGNALEPNQLDNDPVWVPEQITTAWGVDDATEEALRQIGKRADGTVRLGIEEHFLPVRSHQQLASAPGVLPLPAERVLEELRARKSPKEQELVAQASERTVDAILAVFARIRPGLSKREIVEMLRVEEARRGLTFEYCLINLGATLNRGASEQRVQEGDILCLDSGGNYRGFIGDLARMGVVGTPSADQREALEDVERVQQAARQVTRAGILGEELFRAAERAREGLRFGADLAFVAHGMGLVSHEAPRLTDSGPVPYPNDHGGRPLEEGMVLSIESTIARPDVGFVKLEDTVIVTADGFRAVGDQGRGWNECGTAAEATS